MSWWRSSPGREEEVVVVAAVEDTVEQVEEEEALGLPENREPPPSTQPLRPSSLWQSIPAKEGEITNVERLKVKKKKKKKKNCFPASK